MLIFYIYSFLIDRKAIFRNKIIMSTRLTFSGYKQMRWFSTKQKMEVIDNVNELLLNHRLKHKEHPGILKPRQVEQPSWLVDAVQNILQDRTISLQGISASGQKLAAHLHNRQIPPEKKDIRLKMKEVQSRLNQHEMQDPNDDDKFENSKAKKLLKTILYNWTPIKYDPYTSLAYLVNRSMPEYSVLYKIFNEIVNNDKNFTPKTLFDFGSGTGTVMWAASKFWVNSIKEYYCIDISKDMHELSEYLIKRAIPQVESRYIFYRQFFPASPIPTYDIVVSAYSLFELPHQKSRLEIISKLWHKTERYLIIIERGTKAGFKLVNEAREFILHSKKANDVHVFSPCPHDTECPRYTTDNTPCNFEITYLTLPIGGTSIYKRERYSYVVLKKGNRPENDCKWPRIVRQVLKRSRHVICRMCTSSGKLEEQIFTTWKSGKNTYRCARSSEWGDRLPFEIVKVEGEENVEQEEEIEKEKEHT